MAAGPATHQRVLPAPLGVTTRALVLGVLLSALTVLLVMWAEVVIGDIQVALSQFAPAAVGMLLAVVLVNVLLRSLAPRLALRPAEIIFVYAMVLIAALTTSRGLLEKWIPALVATNYFASAANGWQQLLFPQIPSWAVAFDPGGGANQFVAQAFYEGLPPGAPIPWSHWITPLLAWGVPLALLMVAYLSYAAILRRQWVDNERLSFPLAIVPVELAQVAPGARSLLRSPVLWIGFALPTLIYMCNGLHQNYPGFPTFNLAYDLGPSFSGLGRPWSDFGGARMIFSLGAVGFFYFLPTELLLTLWFFFWFTRLQNVGFAAVGVAYEGMPMYPTSLWNGYQVAGGFCVVVAYMARSALPHLRHAWRCAWGQEQQREPELLPYRLAVPALLLAAGGFVLFLNRLGESLPLALLETVTYLGLTVPVMARAVNEAGFLQTETSFRPVDLARLFVPLQSLGARSLTALSLTSAVLTRDVRGNLLSTCLDTLKMADAVRLSRRALLVALVAGLLVALTLGTYLHIALPYRLGAMQMYGYVYTGNPRWAPSDAAATLQAVAKYDPRLPFFFASGVGLTLLLTFMRTRYLWWPLAPLGMALSGTYTLWATWFSLFLAWALKSLIVRYGSMRAYNFLRPFFIGLILGEFSQAIVWGLLSSLFRLRVPVFPLG